MAVVKITAKADLNFKDTSDLREQLGLEWGGRVQRAVDTIVVRKATPYVPMDTGTLAKSPWTHGTAGKVVYPGPYARYLYYGKVMGPNIPVFEDDSGEPTRFFSPPGQKKHLTGKELTYRKDYHALAGPFWIERMKADKMKEIVKEVQDLVNSGKDIEFRPED